MSAAKSPKVRVCEEAWLPWFGRKLRVLVIEDRGPLGGNGRQVVRVQRKLEDPDEVEPDRFEVLAEQLLPLAHG